MIKTVKTSCSSHRRWLGTGIPLRKGMKAHGRVEVEKRFVLPVTRVPRGVKSCMRSSITNLRYSAVLSSGEPYMTRRCCSGDMACSRGDCMAIYSPSTPDFGRFLYQNPRIGCKRKSIYSHPFDQWRQMTVATSSSARVCPALECQGALSRSSIIRKSLTSPILSALVLNIDLTAY